VTTRLADAIGASRVIVSPQYFEAMDIPILEGRALSDLDRVSQQRVVVISKTLARQLWPSTTAVDREIEFGTIRGWNRVVVVGVAADVRSRVLDRPALEVYVPSGRGGLPISTFVLKQSVAAALTNEQLRAALADVDREVVLDRVQTTRAIVDGVIAPARLLSTAMTMLGATGLLLLTLGIFGAAARLLGSARQEVAVRQAVGATPFKAARAPLRVLMMALVLGALMGAAVAPAGIGVLSSMGVAERGGAWLSLAVATASVAVAAALAVGVNIRRATALPPAELLRSQ
jgi:hypothetical protein